mgnify:CR=1 FL=1
MTGLPALNEVAYVRFASVYRKFRDISSFERELSRIRESKESKAPKKPASKSVGQKIQTGVCCPKRYL